MALVNAVTITIRDVAGDKSTVNINFPITITEAQAQSWLDQFASALDNIIDGVIEGASWVRALTLPAGLKTVAGPQRNQIGALMTFDVADTTYAHSVRFPSVKANLLSGKALNLSDTNVQTVRTLLTSGHNDIVPVSRFGSDLRSVSSAMVSYRRKG